MLRNLRRLWRDDRGVAAMEFALAAPLLVICLIGCIEVTFKIWSTAKAEKLAVTLADVVSQSKSVTGDDLDKLTKAVDKIMDPFPFGDDGKVIISAVYLNPGDTVPKVRWQCAYPEGGSFLANSHLGEKTDDANMPPDFDMLEKETAIVAEVFYTYTPVAPGFMFDASTIYRQQMFKPRLGTLTVDPCP